MKVWVLIGNTEGGDEVGPYVFSEKPSEDELKEIAHCVAGYYNLGYDTYEEMCEAGEMGPGDYGSYAYLSLSEVEVQ